VVVPPEPVALDLAKNDFIVADEAAAFKPQFVGSLDQDFFLFLS
jgi:hypothetical protein